MGRIVTEGGTRLEITPEDSLWLARAVEAEGEPRDQVAQVLVNRWAHLWDRFPGTYPTLTSLIRAYAAPVNPTWFPDGAKHLAWMRAHPTDEHELAAAVRRRDVHAQRNEFSERTRNAVASALYGPLTIPPGAVHFGDPSNGRNAIIVDPDARGALYWPLQVGRLEHSSAAVLRHSPAAAIVGAGALLAGAFFWARSHKKGGRR